jgi:hypothetical protein
MTMTITAIDASTVKRAYSGRPGCACGCRGAYWSSSTNTDPRDDVSDRQIARITRLVNEALADLNGQQKNDRYESCTVDGDFVSVSNGRRVYTVYFSE